MSKAKKCDRCGKFYEKNVVMKSKGSALGSIIGGIRTVTKEGITDEDFDLCDDCVKSLYEWKGKPEFEDRWIPVDNGYPDDERKVLVTIKRTEFGKSRYMIGTAEFIRDKYTGREVWNSDEYGVVGAGFQDHVTVTAWMELPKTYKEDTQDE